MLAVEAVNRNSGYVVDAVRDLGSCVFVATNSMLRTKQGSQLHLFGCMDPVNQVLFARTRGVIDDQSDPKAIQGFEAGGNQEISTGRNDSGRAEGVI